MRLLDGQVCENEVKRLQVDQVPSSIRYATALRHLAPGDLLDLVRESEVRAFSPGEIVVREGGLRVEAFLLLSGQVSIRKADSTGRKHVITLRESGDWIGGTGITRRTPHLATVVVEMPTRALAIPKQVFTRVVLASPAATGDLLELAANRLVECVDARLCRFELDGKDDHGWDGQDALLAEARSALGEQRSFHEATRVFQTRLIQQTLDQVNGNVSEAARRLRIARSYIYKLRNSSRTARHTLAADRPASMS